MLLKSLLILALAGTAVAHGGGLHNEIKQKPDGLSWEKWHMIEEHDLQEYDIETFFLLHDIQQQGYWNTKDILNLYGLARESVIGDGSGMGAHEHDSAQEVISQSSKDITIETILKLIDHNNDGIITLDELQRFYTSGGELPDLGFGQGHHLDFESEYEEHHWNKYHRDQDPDVLVKHKEDIEHDLLHHEHEVEQTHGDDPNIRKITDSYRSLIRLHNVPNKYKL